MTIDEVMDVAPVIPVLIVRDAADAAPRAQALVRGGLRAIEVTLRTPAALDVIAAMAAVDGAVVGAGTVLDADAMAAAQAAGARFMVSPGLTDPVVRAARALDVPLLPGVATAGDIMRGLEHGLTRFKFFPAVAAGGIDALKALSAPFAIVRFCPTGGVDAATAADWLALDAVACVGGSWIAPPGAPDIAAIEAAASAASALRRGMPRSTGVRASIR